jgi:hypothetical protein
MHVSSPTMYLLCRSPGAVAAAAAATVRSPPSLYGEWHHVNDGRKGASLLTSQLTRELVTLKDDLIMKTELADALTAKVGQGPGDRGRGILSSC